MNESQSPILAARGLKKSYPMGNGALEVLKGIDFEIQHGQAVCIVGSSGAGKSTLLHLLGTLDRPSAGSVYYKGRDLSSLKDDEMARFRNETMGFVFQFHHLLSEFNALENVMMPCRIAGQSVAESRKRAEELLTYFGLRDRAHHFPSELSGGEQQRVAIARALVRKPQILFADEPTGNLDTQNGHRIQQVFFDLKREMKLTLVAVTHDREFASRFPRVITLRDGRWT
jgi:lipoprotein-releasing system ATP-binding protein